jgi:hypothetical protein
MQELKVLARLVNAKKIPLFVMFMPQLDNLVPTASPLKYKFEFLKLCKENQILVIDVHAKWSNLPPAKVKTYFRDNFHPAVPGNQAAADLLFEQLCSVGKLPACSKNYTKMFQMDSIRRSS